MTTLYAIVGHPVGQVRSPSVFNARFQEAGIEAVMVAMDIEPENFETALAGLRRVDNLGGIVVTVPHKLAAAALAQRRSERVDQVGAANALRPIAEGWEADLFDGIGFVAGLAANGHLVMEKSAAVVGAGGAGLAIAEALLAAGASVDISDRDEGRAGSARSRLSDRYGGRIGIGRPGLKHDIAVNATPVGMTPDRGVPFDPAALGSHALVADAIMKPPMTPLLRRARARGLAVVEGRHMLEGQVPSIWDFLHMGDAGAKVHAA